ncbi:TetR/AcrR family transcriptional regulator [Micromonospora sp. NPDC049051]|uniref:TetR/AcrR family transcriptional regulator n=1 Tax=Micromonospora sp. NPDC049051 TaxID=3364264 RepID=UPI0037234971
MKRDKSGAGSLRADASRNLTKILSAARAVFAEDGLAAPMDLIARRAGVGIGTLYRRFPTRDALVAAIAEEYVTDLVAVTRELGEAEQDVRAALCGLVDWCAEPGRGALAAALADVPTERFHASPPFARARHEWLELVDGLVRRGQRDGVVRPDIGTGDVVGLLNLFACHPDRLPGQVGVHPGRYLRLMLDALLTGPARLGELPGAPVDLDALR